MVGCLNTTEHLIHSANIYILNMDCAASLLSFKRANSFSALSTKSISFSSNSDSASDDIWLWNRETSLLLFYGIGKRVINKKHNQSDETNTRFIQ